MSASAVVIEEIKEVEEVSQPTQTGMPCTRAVIATAEQIIASLAERGIFSLVDYKAVHELHERITKLASQTEFPVCIQRNDIELLLRCIAVGCVKGRAFEPPELMTVGRFYLESAAWLKTVAPA